MVQIFGTAKFPYNIMRTGCVAKDQTQCPLSKTTPNAAHYSSELNRGHLGWPRSISFTWNASNNSAFSMVQLMNWIDAYMPNELAHVGNNFGLKMLLIIFVHFWFCKRLTACTFVVLPVWWGRAAGAAAEPAGVGPRVSEAAQFPQQVQHHHGADPLHFGLLTISSLRHHCPPRDCLLRIEEGYLSLCSNYFFSILPFINSPLARRAPNF